MRAVKVIRDIGIMDKDLLKAVLDEIPKNISIMSTHDINFLNKLIRPLQAFYPSSVQEISELFEK
jgi:hypothetical protein